MPKYLYKNEVIPQEKRKSLNEKVLYLINNNLCSKYKITPEDVYNIYTGRGQTENINFKDYDNYYSYSQERKAKEEGEFFTSSNVCQFIMDILKPSEVDLITDMTAGVGRFCNHVPVENNMYLNDNNINNVKIMRFLYPNATITSDNIQNFKSATKFDLAIGNPPYGLKFGDYTSQFYYCIKANEVLKPLGMLAIVMPNSFMNDEFMDKSIVEYMNKHFNFVCQIDLPIDSFKAVGIQKIETKVVIFQKKSESIEGLKYKKFDFSKLSVTDLSEAQAQNIYKKYIRSLQEQKESLKAKLFYETVHTSHNKNDEEFNFKVQKLLFDIKRNSKLTKYYSKTVEYYNNYFTQQKPENIDWTQWNEIRITKKKVIKYLKNILGKQNKVEQDTVRLVKWNYGLKLKGYSTKTEQYVSKLNNNKVSFNDMILNNNYCFDDKSYLGLLNKKKKEYLRQDKDFNEIFENENIGSYLNTEYLYDNENETKIYLNNKQLIDTNKTLQKRYAYLQWEQGSGKTITGIFQGKYRLQHNNIKNVFVVAPAIAIKNTWSVMLDNFKIDNIIINQLSDINNIEQGQFVLITYNMLIKYQRFIKKYIKMNNKKFMLILDEADGISNTNSKRTKATLNCFRKLPYKLLLSGTSTRNSINEIFPQLELLYNNSINMLSKSEYIYSIDKDDPENLKEETNIYYMKPIPPYKKGFEVFSNSHVPKKISVFGVSKYNQNIYNKDILKELIDKTIITRTLKDITGRELYNIHQVTCKFNEAEKGLYTMILDKFYEMSAEYHIHTGNSQKDSLFKILAQLNTLLKACSIPHSFKEYTDYRLSSKFLKVFQLLNKFNNERVAIGCIRIKAVKLYEYEIRKLFPDRPLFIITGNETTMKQRREIVKELKKYPNAILLSTQQALSCSMNIGFIDKVIIPEMNWNDSSMGQYRGRFIRMNSDNATDVYNVLYDGSIENNLLKLIMCKEKLNLFMKNQDLQDDELFEKYGIDNWLFNCLMTKEKDSEGNIKITWGEQDII